MNSGNTAHEIGLEDTTTKLHDQGSGTIVATMRDK
jgi:hypothetical protein